MNEIIQGDFREILPTLPYAKMIFADPPDNLGLGYVGFDDALSQSAYKGFLDGLFRLGISRSDIFWLSIYHKHLPHVLNKHWLHPRLFIWRFTFGQHRQKDCGNGFRPIIRYKRVNSKIYPDAIREKSKRQELGDKRADPRGRVPDDVWEFPRVCGNFKERRAWHPTQHPEALIERIVKFSTIEGDLVIDCFAGTGTVNRVCKKLNRKCIGIEISKYYCSKIKKELEL